MKSMLLMNHIHPPPATASASLKDTDWPQILTLCGSRRWNADGAASTTGSSCSPAASRRADLSCGSVARTTSVAERDYAKLRARGE